MSCVELHDACDMDTEYVYPRGALRSVCMVYVLVFMARQGRCLHLKHDVMMVIVIMIMI